MKDIRAALEVALSNTAGLPDIVWDNDKNYDPTTDTPYLRAKFIPTSTRPAVRGINPQQRYQGVLQLQLRFPEGEGAGPSEDVVAVLLETFKVTTDLSFTNTELETTYVTIDYAEQVGSFNEAPWYVTPVNIGWHSYK